MNREDKDLLSQDLCARLPYSPICHIVGENNAEIDDILTTSTIEKLDVWVVKPYLRPLSSMTVEEKLEFTNAVAPNGSAVFCNEFVHIPMSADFAQVHFSQHLSYGYIARIIDWLNAHHFDYHGLIDMEIANGVTKKEILMMLRNITKKTI